MATKAHLEGNKRHQDKLDRIVFYMPKGGKEEIKAAADQEGVSPNKFVADAVTAKIKKLQSP